MGCGNSSAAANSKNSSSTAGPAETSSKVSEDSGPEDDKWKNYGGVYVGFPTDLSNIPHVQIGSLRGGAIGNVMLCEGLTYNGHVGEEGTPCSFIVLSMSGGHRVSNGLLYPVEPLDGL